MKTGKLIGLFVLLGMIFMASEMTTENAAAAEKREPGTYAVFDTTHGKIVCRFFEKEAPKTVANFVGLAEGTKEWTDPKTGQKKKSRYFDGLIFHRVIDGFMMQGGDPTGTGSGGPGYEFENETKNDLKFDRPGRLAMANRGPNTNGSQFFITQVPYPSLNGGYTIFGQVVEGQAVVDKICKVEKGPQDRPKTPVVMNKVTIERVK